MATLQTSGTCSVILLNSFLRGEISAVESYRKALGVLTNSSHAAQLAECKKSHEERIAILTEQVRKLGGNPADSSGVWGTFAKLVESGATALGEKGAIAALQQGEEHGSKDYQADVLRLTGEARAVVETRVLPLQYRTHAVISALKKTLS